MAAARVEWGQAPLALRRHSLSSARPPIQPTDPPLPVLLFFGLTRYIYIYISSDLFFLSFFKLRRRPGWRGRRPLGVRGPTYLSLLLLSRLRRRPRWRGVGPLCVEADLSGLWVGLSALRLCQHALGRYLCTYVSA